MTDLWYHYFSKTVAVSTVVSSRKEPQNVAISVRTLSRPKTSKLITSKIPCKYFWSDDEIIDNSQSLVIVKNSKGTRFRKVFKLERSFQVVEKFFSSHRMIHSRLDRRLIRIPLPSIERFSSQFHIHKLNEINTLKIYVTVWLRATSFIIKWEENKMKDDCLLRKHFENFAMFHKKVFKLLRHPFHKHSHWNLIIVMEPLWEYARMGNSRQGRREKSKANIHKYSSFDSEY